MTNKIAKDIDVLVHAAFDLPAPEMPNVFDNDIVELEDDDLEMLAAAGTKTINDSSGKRNGKK